MKIWNLILLMIALGGCSIGKKEVKYSEMSSPPKLFLEQDGLTIHINNSLENSSLLIYEIRPSIDQQSKTILLTAFQAAGKEYKTEFRIRLKDIDPDKITEYGIFWKDPDNKRTALQLETNILSRDF